MPRDTVRERATRGVERVAVLVAPWASSAVLITADLASVPGPHTRHAHRVHTVDFGQQQR